ALRTRRRTRGALELDVPEVRARVDEHGHTLALERREHLESHELVEEFMLLANRCVGEEGTRRGAGLLYRVHEPPSPRKLEDLDAMLKTLGLPRPGRLDDPARALQALLAVPPDPAHRAEHRRRAGVRRGGTGCREDQGAAAAGRPAGRPFDGNDHGFRPPGLLRRTRRNSS